MGLIIFCVVTSPNFRLSDISYILVLKYLLLSKRCTPSRQEELFYSFYNEVKNPKYRTYRLWNAENNKISWLESDYNQIVIDVYQVHSGSD